MTKHVRKKTNAPFAAATWKNKLFDRYVVQALRRHDEPLGKFLHHGRCRHGLPKFIPFAPEGMVKMADGTRKPVIAITKEDALLHEGKIVRATGVLEAGSLAEVWLERHDCAGTSTHALSGVLLDRREALHAVYAHYRFANQSVCRFRTAAKGDYAADLILDIDAHDHIGAPVELAWFDRYIAAAVTVGRRVLDYLVGVLEIDPKYITTAVTRMGCRVTVDWRAFGPRRLHELLLVVRYIEAQVLGSDELAELASRFNVPKIEIDTKIYERSDLPRLGVDDCNGFGGPWLRPVGALHHRSGEGGWWYRVTPVPLDSFRPENAAWLVKESRGANENWHTWPERELDHRFVGRVPESRNPALDVSIEADPRPALKLIELFERDDLLDHIGEDHHRGRVREVQQKSCTGARLRPQGGLCTRPSSPSRSAGLLSRTGRTAARASSRARTRSLCVPS